MDIQRIVEFLGAIGIGSATVAFLLRSLFKHTLSRDLESFKSSLTQRAFEHQIRFSKLHETRAKVIAGTYSRLVQYEINVRSLIKPARWPGETADSDKYKKAQGISVDFWTYFSCNRIYFPESVAKKIEEVGDHFHGMLVDSGMYLDIDREAEKWKVLRENWKKLEAETMPLKQELEGLFRGLLGDAEKGHA